MSKSIRVILLFVGIGLFGSIIYFALNSTNDSTSYHIIPIELKVAEKSRGGSVWYFSGTVYDSEAEIKMSVRSPDGNIITTDTIIPSKNGNFEIEITTGGPLWKTPGKYLLILEQGEFKEIQTFKILEHEISIPVGFDSESEVNSLRPDDRLQIRHSAGYTTVYITLSSWDEYNEWEKKRGTEHDAKSPVIIDDDNINPIVFDLLNEMWKFEDYEVSKRDDNLFTKKIQKDYSVPNHHGIHDWLESEYAKQFGESNDGFSNHFEYKDNVYHVAMMAVD